MRCSCSWSGRLLSGSALAGAAPGVHVSPASSGSGNDGSGRFRSAASSHIDTPQTIADGCATQHLGALTFGDHSGDVRRDPDRVRTTPSL
jgi:threonine dehydratase